MSRPALLSSALTVLAPCVALLVALPGPRSARAESYPTDELRSAFKQRRTVTVGRSTESGATDPGATTGTGFAVLPLPPELGSGGSPPWRDLRLHRLGENSEREVPYVVDEQQPYQVVDAVVGKLVDTRSDHDLQTVWVVDLERVRTFELIEFEIPETSFAKRLKIELASHRDGPFRVLRSDYGVFDRPWTPEPGLRVHHTSVALDAPERARFLRITADDRRWNRPITMSGVRVSRSSKVTGTRWTRPAPLVEIPEAVAPEAAKGKHGAKPASGPRWSRYRLDVPGTLPIEEITLSATDPAFARRIRLVEESPENSKASPEVRAEGLVFRVADGPASSPNAGPEELAGEELTLRVSSRPTGQPLVLEIDNGAAGGPPLSGVKLSISGTGARLIFPLLPGDERFVIYYGSPTAREPLYDLALVQSRLAQLELRPATLGPQEPNPQYRTVPPLKFVKSVGADLDASRFRLVRSLQLRSGDPFPEIFGVLLGAADVGVLKPDLADVRIVDAQNRQVPYVLEPAASEARADLVLAPLPAEGKKSLSRWKLSYTSGRTQALPLPLDALELEITQEFYSRPVRVLTGPGDLDGRPPLTPLFSGQLVRQGDDGGVQRVSLGGGRHRELVLEIDNQDNPPLDVQRVLGVVTVPRLAFKLDEAGEYRVLLGGDDDVAVPRYDIETLRRQVLDYAALPARLGDVQSNPLFRARAGDFLKNAPPTALLWGVLGVAVVALLGLTLRLLKKPVEE